MKVTVVHDDRGEIVAVAKIGNLAQAGSKFTRAGLLATDGQSVIEIELSEEQAARPARARSPIFAIATMSPRSSCTTVAFISRS